jgi:hypothetical protein
MPNDDEAQKIELNGATVQGRAIVVTNLSPNQKAKEEVLITTGGGDSRGGYGKQPDNRGGETEEDINILFINYKKRYQCKLIPFFCFYHIYKSCKLT